MGSCNICVISFEQYLKYFVRQSLRIDSGFILCSHGSKHASLFSGHDGFDFFLGFSGLKGGTNDGVGDILWGLSLEHIGGGLKTELLSKSNELVGGFIILNFDGGDGGEDGEEESGSHFSIKVKVYY